jgi:pimeloyl-ACP methyl ester carboxylesterase
VRGGGLVALAIVAGGLAWWTLAAPEADPAALLVVETDPEVVVVREDGLVALHPASGPSERAVVLYPGARVPADAYLATVRPLVVATGVSVYLPEFPLRFALLDRARADRIRAERPEVREWWIGGHSLGGAMAANHAAASASGRWRGLLLLAAYPSVEGLAGREDLVVLSLVGGRDGLTTLADVERRRALLPAAADVRVLDGVNHAQFGRYGVQAGDLEPTVDDATATGLIVAELVRAVGDG